jgi:hypothetical protein
VESLDGQAGEKHLPNLACAVDNMVAAFPSPPPYNACYAAEWIAFASGNRKHLDLSAVRYLCWEPNIATSDPFLAYLWRRGVKLKSRPLAGLVRSCHAVWKAGPGTYPAAGVVKDLVKQYEGSSQVILKWKSNLNAVFGAHGPEVLGRSLIAEKKKLSFFLEEWYLDPQSPFARQVVERATAFCRDQFDRSSPAVVRTLFGELLPWAGWDMPALRQEIEALILRAEDGQTRSTLRKFVMIHGSLGDPRLPKNQANWAEMNGEAKSRFEGWLLAGTPPAPVERVYPQGKRLPVEKSSPVEKPSPAETETPSPPMERVYRQGKGWTLQPVGETHYEAARFGSAGT